MFDVDVKALHNESIVIDGCCPLLVDFKYLDWYKEGGCTTVTPTIGGFYPAQVSFQLAGAWLEVIRERGDLLLVESVQDVRKAKEQNKLGIIMHLQGTDPIEDDLNLVNGFKKLGVGIIQLTYNVENRIGYGAQVEDKGLKPFGREVIKRCNDTKVIVDCSHTGYRTTMEAIETSQKPVIFSHANPMGVHKTESSRNITDDQIQAIAETGGVIGVTGFPGFLSSKNHSSLDLFLDHIDYIVKIGGIDHVSLGIDYYLGQHPIADPKSAQENYDYMISGGHWCGQDYPPPPHHYPEGIETPKTLQHLTSGLVARGYSSENVKKILGLNLMRVYEAVWDD